METRGEQSGGTKDADEILVVEDSLTQAKRLERLLEAHGYAVRVARSGTEGLAAAKIRKPSVVLTDVVMPEMDGFDMCRQIKEDETLREVPVVLLTALSDPRDVIRGLQCGADNFLTKPYEEEYLLQRIHHILANRELRRAGHAQMTVEVVFAGQRHVLNADRIQIIDLLLSTFEAAVLQNNQLAKLSGDYRHALDDVSRVQANFRTLMETTGDAVVVVDGEGLVRYTNPAAEVLFGRDASSLMHRPFVFSVDEEGAREVTILRPDGLRLVGDMRVVNSHWDGNPVRLATLRDITETVQLRERLKTEAITDPLTGLLNRRGFMSFGENCLQLADRMGCRVSCLFADLDGFKAVNDTLGHDEGDRVLQEAAEVLRENFRVADIIGRVGGDEFAVLMVQDAPGEDACPGERLRRILSERGGVVGRSYRLSMSLGIHVREPRQALALGELLALADQKMYGEKNAKRQAQA